MRTVYTDDRYMASSGMEVSQADPGRRPSWPPSTNCLHPAPQLYGGRVLWSGEHAAAVVDAFRQITTTAPDELTVWLDLLHFPGAEPMAAVDATYLGDA